ncbi:hypothetical protein VB005_04661 [Metarhizium brunneum]
MEANKRRGECVKLRACYRVRWYSTSSGNNEFLATCQLLVSRDTLRLALTSVRLVIRARGEMAFHKRTGWYWHGADSGPSSMALGRIGDEHGRTGEVQVKKLVKPATFD